MFDKIIVGEVPADNVYEDGQCFACRDISPQAPVHVLLVPRQRITGLRAVTAEHEELLGHQLIVAHQMAQQQGDGGFRCVINAGADGGQKVPHLHIHVLIGRSMTAPPD
ncbi:MAG: HIT domain-containing protein [Candidatus Latescibacterota bacterium]|nr:HIT domain-containing protein [Candidatus Latescibacterota bacterium]